MKAAILEQTGKPLVVKGNVEPMPLEKGQVSVELAYSGVCHSQLQEVRGGRGEDKWLPHLLGHEGTGIVREIGPGVTKVKVGDKVILTWIKGKGIEAGGAKYSCEGETINAGGVTTFNEHATISENRLVLLPEGIPMDIGVLFGCALLTGAGLVMNEVKPHEGSTILVMGLGGVGLSGLLACSLFKCSKIIAVDTSPEKLELAKDFGATHTINGAEHDVVQMVREFTQGEGVDYAVEAAGATKTIEMAFQSVKKNGGLCVFASHPSAGQKIEIDPYDLICGKQIRGSWGGACDSDRDIPIMAKLYTEGKLPLEKMMSGPYTLDQINTCIDDLENKKALRPIVTLNADLIS